MDLSRIDLNQLVHLDVLLRERNVTRAANHLKISQPAMSNSLKRLRSMFHDPLLVRTSDGMIPTPLAFDLQPKIRDILSAIDQVMTTDTAFDANSHRTFRIMASDYAESTLFPPMLKRLREIGPNITLDILTPSDVTFADVEQGRVDMAINRFDSLPNSFHQKPLWRDSFSCVMRAEPSRQHEFDLNDYLRASHIWVSKTGFGIGVGLSPDNVQRLGWVDEALGRLGHTRRITVFTRHYQIAMQLARQHDLVATLPTLVARTKAADPEYHLCPPPFPIEPFELKMAWSPLLHHESGHQWLRQLITTVAADIQPDG